MDFILSIIKIPVIDLIKGIEKIGGLLDCLLDEDDNFLVILVDLQNPKEKYQ
jgi:hypothetical protein